MKPLTALFLCSIFNLVFGRDFYVGMFKKNDLLVAQDRLYKEGVPFRRIYAKYGRIFKCPITYFRVVDRLGMGRGPKVEIIRGGIRHKFLVLRLQSVYSTPISVNIYVGCENMIPKTTSSKALPEITIAQDHAADTTNFEEKAPTTLIETSSTTVLTTDA